MVRVDNFLIDKGLSPSRAILLNPEDVPVFRQKLADFGWSHPLLDELGVERENGFTWMGGNFDDLGLVVMVRSPQIEEANGTAYTEATLLHEKAHSAHAFDDLIYTKAGTNINYWVPRHGHGIAAKAGSEGAFFEEGFAELLAAEYMKEQMGMPNGVWDEDITVPTKTGDDLPGIYAWKVDDSKFLYANSAIAAHGLELLMVEKSELYQALLKARNSVEGLRQVAQVVDSVEPGLYPKLRKLSYSEAGFSEGLHDIKSALSE